MKIINRKNHNTGKRKGSKLFIIIGVLSVICILLGISLYITNDTYQKRINEMSDNITSLNKTIGVLTDPVHDYVVFLYDVGPKEAKLLESSKLQQLNIVLIGKVCIALNGGTWPPNLALLGVRCKLENMKDLFRYLDSVKIQYEPMGRVDDELLKSFYHDGYSWY